MRYTVNLVEVFRRFPDQQACIDHLEAILFRNGAYCPLCGSVENVRRKKENNLVGRWNCHDCKKSFNVLSGTVMQGTHMPLAKVDPRHRVDRQREKEPVQLPVGPRDLELTQPTAWYMQQRIRAAMASDQAPMLAGVIEAVEAWLGGKPRKKQARRRGVEAQGERRTERDR